MKITIRKGHHRSWWPTFGIFWGKKNMERLVTFHSDCAYSIEGEDQGDINKLFGIGYFPHHHIESARFGWNYNEETHMITLSAYCYVEGKREVRQIMEVPLEREVTLKLVVGLNYYYLDVRSGVEGHYAIVFKQHKRKWAYLLGPYFGGNKTAPHDITLTMKKL